MSTLANLDAFTKAYLVCALWSSTDESTPQGGDPMDSNYGLDDISEELLKVAVEDCTAFQTANAEMLARAYELYAPHPDAPEKASSSGHDFWLTRNRHGAGFWDRGMGEVGDALTKASHEVGEVSLYVGDDGEICQY